MSTRFDINDTHPFCCPGCGAHFKTKRGMTIHRSSSLFCKRKSFSKVMRKEGMARVDEQLYECAEKVGVEVYTDKFGMLWVPMWFIQITRTHARVDKPKRSVAGVVRRRITISKEGRSLIAKAKRSDSFRGALTLKYKLGNMPISADTILAIVPPDLSSESE